MRGRCHDPRNRISNNPQYGFRGAAGGGEPLGGGRRRTGCAMDLIVDGMNVIGTRPDGWWRDRRAARRATGRGPGPAWRRRGPGQCGLRRSPPRSGEADDARRGRAARLLRPGGPERGRRRHRRDGRRSRPSGGHHRRHVGPGPSSSGSDRLGVTVESAKAFRSRRPVGVPDVERRCRGVGRGSGDRAAGRCAAR